MGAIVRILPTLPERRVFEEELPVETTEQEPFAIEKEGGYYIVTGPAMEPSLLIRSTSTIRSR